MVVGIKDTVKLLGISIIACCAVFVCTMFLNFNLDLVGIKEQINGEQILLFYNVQLSTAKLICLISGGCLFITSVIMLFFYIKHYIDTHKKELGILKALGYSNFKIAKNFWIFAASVFVGTSFGFGGAFLIIPSFYEMQNADHILPEVTAHFHPILMLYLIVIPTIVFALLAICYAYFKLQTPVMYLMKNSVPMTSKIKKYKDTNKEYSFIEEVKKNTLKSKKTLVFFIVFASFCFSAMTQMSFSMKELASEMMGVIIMLIGVILACTTLFLAITTVINGNTKTIAMMRIFGYSQKECCKALLDGYRPLAYLGFILGTIYQYALLKIMVEVAYKDIGTVPTYSFDLEAMLISLVAFIIIYEIVIYCYSRRIKNISIKEIMLD